MARVVQRQTSPPYLLFLFLFLFLIATTVAIIFYTKWSDTSGALARAQSDQETFYRPSDINDPAVSAMVAQARQGRTTVLRQMLKEQGDLAAAVTGTAVDAQQAITEAQTTLASLEASTGLVALAQQQSKDIEALREQNKQLSAQNDQLAANLQARSQALAQAQQEFTSQVDQLKQQLQGEQTKLSDLTGGITTRMGGLRSEFKQLSDEKDRQISLLIQQKNDLNQQLADRDARTVELLSELEKRKPAGPGMAAATTPDGRVLRVQPDLGIAYINVGARDRVKVGMPFEVYSARKGISDEGRGKGSLIVTDVQAGTAEAEITRWQGSDPIIEGDLIGNIAFDPNRSYTFVVMGDFDINGDGRPDPLGQQRVKQLILEYGGRLADEVSVDTDFVVMGTAPNPGRQPRDDEPETTRMLYQNRMAEAGGYQSVQQAATALRIPILNTNRFLSFLGFTPEVLKY